MSLLSDILLQLFGHREFRGSQQAVIERVLSGSHSLVIMPTGMGKSLCYQLPAIVLANRSRPNREHPEAPGQLAKAPLTLVISPLIALMKDQVDALLGKGVDATFINSSLQRSERILRYQQIALGHYDLVYVTPERFRKSEFWETLAEREIVFGSQNSGAVSRGNRTTEFRIKC